MRSKRVQNRLQKAVAPLWAAFACAEVVGEAMSRLVGPGGVDSPSVPSTGDSSRGLFRLLGRGLLRQLERLRKADDRYQRLRARQRRRQVRRDVVARRLYREVVAARRYLKGLFGPEGVCLYCGLQGETPREPWELLALARETVLWAQSREVIPESDWPNAEALGAKCIDDLDALCRELDEALEAVGRGHRETEAAMLGQRQEIKDFDRVCNESARAMEAKLIFVGLPTLSAAVRPGVGRRGRPLKKRPVDRYPDLVQRVCDEGVIAVELKDPRTTSEGVATLSPEGESGSAHLGSDRGDAPKGSEGLATSRDGLGEGKGSLMAISPASRNGSAGSDLVEQAFLERSTREEKIEQAFPECEAGSDLIEQPSPEPSGSEEKIEQLFPDSQLGKAASVVSGLRPLPPAAVCTKRSVGGYRPPRRSSAHRPPAHRSGASTTERSTLRQAAATWWGRLKRSA